MGSLSQPSGKGLPLGLTGATAATRYVGATASGAPASGTFAVGDFIIDRTGKVYVCTVAGTSGTWMQVGGSSAAPITRQQLTGNAVNVANGAGGVLTWDHAFGPDVLLDRAVPAAPAIITAGVYVVVVQVGGTGLTVGGNFNVQLSLDHDGEDATVAASSAPSIVGNTSPTVTVTMAYYIGAAGTLRVVATNEDGVAARDFKIDSAIVQRVS